MASRSPQPTDVMLSIGGVVGHVALGTAPPAFLDQVRARYDAFFLPPAEWVDRAFALKLNFLPAIPARPTGRTEEQRSQPLVVSATTRVIKIDRWDFSVRLTAEIFRGRPRWSGTGRCEMNPFALDSLLRVLWSIFLPHNGGALLHACGLRLQDMGVVFPGVSEQGKTTLARKMDDPDDVLSDELVAVYPDADGAWRIAGTPFWGDFQRGGISIRSWPLRCVAFLKQGQPAAVTPLTSADATLKLLECFLCFQTDDDTIRRNLGVAVKLCDEMRAVELQTMRQTPIPEILRKLGPHLGPPAPHREPPHNAREMISEFRSFLKKHRTYAFNPKGSSMRPWLKGGDSLFIQLAGESELAAGDVLLYWSPGETPAADVLTCHRMVARVASDRGSGSKFLTKGDALSTIERFENGRQSEILGKVSAISRDGKTWPMPGRVGNLARLFGSLVAMPILKMAGR